MISARPLYALCCALLIAACASTSQTRPESMDEPALIADLPAELESFDYEGYRFFDDEDDGYTFRYSNARKQRLADIYVYPVSADNRALDHDQLVMGSTRATMQAIGEAVREGLYANFNVIGAATQARGLRTIARVEATYLRENLASYTLVYQTEYDGTLVKIRVSMPDNQSNRSNLEWDRFASKVFDLVVTHLDEQQLETRQRIAAKRDTPLG